VRAVVGGGDGTVMWADSEALRCGGRCYDPTGGFNKQKGAKKEILAFKSWIYV
jgi:hypothetical protein